MSKLTGSRKALQFTESVIREMTRLSDAHNAVNLSQGFPDFAAPQAVKDAACEAINADDNQYAVTWGQRPLREAVAREFTRRYGELPQDQDLLIICHSGYRSGQAANFLLRHGYPRAFNVVGGMEEWEEAGLPVERR